MVYLSKIFDAHVHFRTGDMLRRMIGYIVKYCYAAVAMGNTQPPYAADNVDERREEIKVEAARHGRPNFRPIMTVMMVSGFNQEMVERARKRGVRIIKLIPGNTSTGSSGMVALKHLPKYYDVLRYAAKFGMTFSLHCELSHMPESGAEISYLDREVAAIPFLRHLIDHVPDLSITVEHISTAHLLDFVLKGPERVRGTVTAHHLFGHYGMVFNRYGEIKAPENFCMPILKPIADGLALQDAVLKGGPKLMFGSDFAPHPPETKDLKKLGGRMPNAGIICPHKVAIPLIWQELFCKHYGEGREARERFKHFMSGNAAKFHGWEILGQSQAPIRLERRPWTTPKTIAGLSIFWGGRELEWRIVDE